MTVNEYFDHAYCVNLNNRPERWSESRLEFLHNGIEVERFFAVKDNPDNIAVHHPALKKRPGLVGCTLSHLAVLKDAREKKYETILVFEDDIVLCPDFNKEFSLRINQLPDDWDMFYLSGNNFYNGNNENGLISVSSHISKTTKTLTTHAYAVHCRVYDQLIEGISTMQLPIDMHYRKFQEANNVYISRPHLGWQRPGHSDIMGGYRNYKNIRK